MTTADRSIRVTASNPRPTTTGVDGAVDVTVSVSLPGRRKSPVRGEVTLCPAEDGRPVYECWGDCAECWVSGALLAEIQAAYPDAPGHGYDCRDALCELSAVAGRAAGRPS